MEKSVTELMGMKYKDLKLAIKQAKELENQGLYNKNHRELLEYAYQKKQEQEKLLIGKRIHNKLIEELEKRIERKNSEIINKTAELQEMKTSLTLAKKDDYRTEIADFESQFNKSKKKWSIDIYFDIDGEEVSSYIFIDKETEE